MPGRMSQKHYIWVEHFVCSSGSGDAFFEPKQECDEFLHLADNQRFSIGIDEYSIGIGPAGHQPLSRAS